jgi:hypothetical protein
MWKIFSVPCGSALYKFHSVCACVRACVRVCVCVCVCVYILGVSIISGTGAAIYTVLVVAQCNGR